MSNVGRYVDRNPDIRAAGLPGEYIPNEIGGSLKVYPTSELAEVWFKSLCPKKPRTELFPGAPILHDDSLQEVLAPEFAKSRFTKFKEQFFEDLYLKKPELGKARMVHSIPKGITNENTTFGIKTVRTDDLYNVVLPPKSVAQVNKEYLDWHNKYLISHNHYLPGERINRNYNEKFNPDASFGTTTKVDITGGNVARVLKTQGKLAVVKDLQRYYLERNFGDVGKKISKFHDSHLDDRNRVYGHPPDNNKCTLRDVVHNINSCEEDTDLLKAIAYLIYQRRLLQKDPQFDVYELEKNLEKQDPEKTGYITLETAFRESRLLHIFLNEPKMRKALIFYKLVEDIGLPTERIKIENFSKALQFRYLLPEVAVERANPAFKLDTTYRELCSDHLKPLPPTIPHAKPREEVVEDYPTPEQFNKPREKSSLKLIFSEVVCGDTFDRIWDAIIEKERPENNLVSINAFRSELAAEREKLQKEKNS